MHVIKLDGYNATVDNGEKLELGTFDSFGEEQLQIVKAPDWVNLSVIATFNPPNRKPVQAVVDSVTGVIKVPKEATAGWYGVGTIVFVGLADGVQRISSDVEYIVRKHSNASGTEPAEPTPDLMQQVLTLSKDAQTAAKNAVKDAAAAKANADKAQQAAENAAADAAKAGPYTEAALNAKKAAEAARDTAISAGAYAENAENAAAGAMTAAAESASKAAASEKAAAAIAIAAAGSATQAEAQKTAAAKAASDAQGYMQAASSAATAANASAENAAGSKAAAASSATASANSATAAAASATTASAKATEAADSASAAAASEQAAAQAAEIAQDAAESLQPEVDQIKDDLANKVPKSDYAPEEKTDAMTQPVGKDADGKLWTAPGSGGSGITVSGATVGQTVRIADVDDDGVPTAWEPVDLPSGGGDLQWYKVAETKITEEITEYVVSQDFDGNPIKSYNPVAIALYFAVPADSTQASASGAPWIYPSASTYVGETGIRVIANIANWKTIARTNTQVFFGSEHGIVGIGSVTTGSFSALNLGHVIMDGVKIYLHNNGDHFPVGTHFIVSVLGARA